MSNPAMWQLSGFVLIAGLFFYILSVRYTPGLRQLPGPALASFSYLDRIWSCASGRQMDYHLELHQKYGPLVRVGPKHVSISDTSLIPQIYGIASKFWKSEFYLCFGVRTEAGQVQTVFSARDEEHHRALKRPVAHAYALSTLKELEPMNDDCSAILLNKLEKYAGTDLDLGKWLHWYAFDVITSITFSNRIGMMDQEHDVENIIAAIEGRLVYNAIIGQAPYLHKYLLGNRVIARIANVIPAIAKLNSTGYIVAFAGRQLQRYQNKEFNTADLADLLDRFKRFKDGEEVMSDTELRSHAYSNIFAGSDTTAISLRTIFYYACRNPRVHEKLLDEIDGADRRGELSDPVTFAEAQDLKYFQAIVKEALRMHPAVGLLLERVVPPGGAELGNVKLPGGTIVGINPWVAARDSSVYGNDAHNFRPERWLEADDLRLKLMDRTSLAFGAGARSCLGKNISILEISKLVPQLLRRFDFELSDPEKEWTLHDYWFVQQTGLICRVKKRQP